MVLLHRFLLDLAQRLSVRTGVPEHLFYLVQQSKVLSGSWALARAGISSYSHVHMCGRLRGGAGGGRVRVGGVGTANHAACWGVGPRNAGAFGVVVRAMRERRCGWRKTTGPSEGTKRVRAARAHTFLG